MTQQEILDYNKRCAEFLGAEIQDVLERIYIDKMKDDEMTFHNLSVTLQTYEWNGTANIHYIPFDMLQFHSDWNWIMEVKSRIVNLQLSVSPSIHRLYFNTFACKKNHNEEFVYKVRIHSDFKELEFKSESNDEKEAVVQAINQFLIWYNEKNK